MKLTKTAQNILDVVIARLDTEDPAHLSSNEVRAALSGPARIYLTSHVLPLLDALLNEAVPYWMRDAVQMDADRAYVRRGHKGRRTFVLTVKKESRR